jgi:hypothetical protein
MNNKQYGTITTSLSGKLVFEVSTGEDITHLFRKSMIDAAEASNDALVFNHETQKARRISADGIPAEILPAMETAVDVTLDPVMALINRSHEIKPKDLEMSDIKWKYLVRSAVRGKNIMCVGPAGSGKTQAAKALVNVPVVNQLEVTEEEYQTLLKDPNVISVTKL